MHATSDSLKQSTNHSVSWGLEMPLAELHLSQVLMLTQWAATLWMFGQSQFSRYSTFLAGGAPIDA